MKRQLLFLVFLALSSGCCNPNSDMPRGIPFQVLEGEVDLNTSAIHAKNDLNHLRTHATPNFFEGDYMKMDRKQRVFNQNYLRYIDQQFKRFEVLDYLAKKSVSIVSPESSNIYFRRPNAK